VAVVTATPESQAFAGLSAPPLPLPCAAEGPAMLRIRAWGRGLRRRAPALSSIALRAERAAGRLIGGGTWTRFFREHSIDAVVTASATGGRTLPALQAAANLGLPSAVLLNSWKDLHGRGAPPAPVSALGVVTPAELAQASACGAPAAVYGSLHQAAVRRGPAMSRGDFCQALGLDPRRPILCYATAMNDPEEAGRLDWLAGELPRLATAPQLVVRANPMCAGLDLYEALERRPGVAVQRPRWEWSRERDWCCPLPEDLPWWRATLEHSAAALTLPSTIALDFSAWGKPTVNIAWGPGRAPWRAESYSAIRRNPGALGAESPGHALDRIEALLREPPPLPLLRDDPVSAALQLIQQACAPAAAGKQPRSSALEAVAP
jgi:hypothetical protein